MAIFRTTRSLFKIVSTFLKSRGSIPYGKTNLVPDSNNSGPSCDRAVQPPGTAAQPGATRAFEERHYAVAEIAALWNLSVDAVRKLFRNEPGVLVLGDANPRGKRRYVTLRIPASVLERVHRQMSLSNHYQKR